MTINSINNQIPNNDFLVQKTGSGTTVTSTIQQTSNTASATAKEAISVAGGTASDAFTNYVVTGVTSWSKGIDNSDSDAYVISATGTPGTTNVCRIGVTGEVRRILQPAFYVESAALADDVTGNGTTYTPANLSVEFVDQNNDFDGVSTFTAPVTGIYLLRCDYYIFRATSSHTSNIESIITSNRTYTYQANLYNQGETLGNSEETHSCVILADMDASDTAYLTIKVSNGTKVIDIISLRFAGYLVC